jgi:integrase
VATPWRVSTIGLSRVFAEVGRCFKPTENYCSASLRLLTSADVYLRETHCVTLTPREARNTPFRVESGPSVLQKLIQWRSGYRTDRHMAGVIRADKVLKRGRRCECGGSYAQRKRRDFDNPIPVCVLCGETPELYFIRMTLPVIGEHEIRYYRGERITKAAAADACLKQIREEVANGTFDPLKYLSQQKRSEFLFKNFAPYYLKTRLESPDRPITASSAASIRTSLTNYLIPFFGEQFIQDISSKDLKRFLAEWKPVEGARRRAKTTRSRDVALECMKAILNFARELEVLPVAPVFPKIPRSRRARQRIPGEIQQLVIERMRDPYRAATEAMRLLICRPSEIRALQWRDIDWDRRVVHIRRHWSKGGQLVEGRKSVRDQDDEVFDHQVPFGDAFLAVLARLPRSLNPEAWVFTAPRGGRPKKDAGATIAPSSQLPIGPGKMLEDWRRALKSYNEEHGTSFEADLYRGVKSSTVTHLEQSGVPRDDLRKLAGHKTSAMTGRYSTDAVEHLRGVTEGVILKLTREKERPRDPEADR